MRHIGRYTFRTEEERKGDYARRVGPLRRLRCNTVEPPEGMMSRAEWLDWLRLQRFSKK